LKVVKPKLVIDRIKKTDGEDNNTEKENIEFFNNFFKEHNINIYGDINLNKNRDNNKNKNENLFDRELYINRDKNYNTNQFILNINNNDNNND
jgi:hypothetical protein